MGALQLSLRHLASRHVAEDNLDHEPAIHEHRGGGGLDRERRPIEPSIRQPGEAGPRPRLGQGRGPGPSERKARPSTRSKTERPINSSGEACPEEPCRLGVGEDDGPIQVSEHRVRRGFDQYPR